MIGDILKKVRNIYGYRAIEMANLINISPSYLSEIENNKKKPSLELLEKYSEICKIKLSTLIILSEEYENYKEKNENAFVRKMMLALINKLSDDKE